MLNYRSNITPKTSNYAHGGHVHNLVEKAYQHHAFGDMVKKGMKMTGNYIKDNFYDYISKKAVDTAKEAVGIDSIVDPSVQWLKQKSGINFPGNYSESPLKYPGDFLHDAVEEFPQSGMSYATDKLVNKVLNRGHKVTTPGIIGFPQPQPDSSFLKDYPKKALLSHVSEKIIDPAMNPITEYINSFDKHKTVKKHVEESSWPVRQAWDLAADTVYNIPKSIMEHLLGNYGKKFVGTVANTGLNAVRAIGRRFFRNIP